MRQRVSRPRIIGTIEERIAVLQCARNVIEAMKKSGHFKGIDLETLSTTVIGFLREPAPKLLGICSYSRNGTRGRTDRPGENTWRILVKRSLIHDDPQELAATIYHEYLHAILGYDEGHGTTFSSMEALWPLGTGAVGL